MYRILVVEDNTELYEKELRRYLEAILPAGKFELHRAAGLEEAAAVVTEPWDVILVGYSLGHSAPTVPEEPEGKRVRNGAEFVALRRTVEVGSDALGKPSTIIGISSFQVSNAQMVEAGANTSVNKSRLEDLAREVERGLEAHA